MANISAFNCFPKTWLNCNHLFTSSETISSGCMHFLHNLAIYFNTFSKRHNIPVVSPLRLSLKSNNRRTYNNILVQILDCCQKWLLFDFNNQRNNFTYVRLDILLHYLEYVQYLKYSTITIVEHIHILVLWNKTITLWF